MKLTRTLIALAATLLAAALVAGCGGPSKADYEKDVKKIGAQVEKDIDKLDSGQPSPDDIEQAQKSIDEAAADIDDIDPPSEVKDLHEDLVKVLEDTADLLGRLQPLMEQATENPEKMGEAELKEMNEITSDFEKIEQEMDRVTKGYEKKQYDIGLGDE